MTTDDSVQQVIDSAARLGFVLVRASDSPSRKLSHSGSKRMVTKRNPKAALKQTQKLIASGQSTIMLPMQLDEILTNEDYRHWQRANGQSMDSFVEAVTTSQPHGLGIGQFKDWISAEQAYLLSNRYPKVKKALMPLVVEEAKPIAEHGTIGNGRSRVDNVKSTQGGNSAAYLLGRMKREAASNKDVVVRDRCQLALKRLAAGELTSVRKAAIACGIIKVDSDKDRCPIQRIKMYWKRADAKQRKELLAWLKSAEAKLQ